jgi:hypothetical protein
VYLLCSNRLQRTTDSEPQTVSIEDSDDRRGGLPMLPIAVGCSPLSILPTSKKLRLNQLS